MPRARDQLRQQAADLRAQLQQAEEERDGWKQLADFAVPRMEAAENAVRIGLDLLPKLWTERDAAIERAEAAEALAERRLQRGLAALDILRAVLEAGHTTVTVGDYKWKGWGTARVLTPAEAQKEGD